MDITVQYIKDRFEVFNKQMFGGALPLPVIRVSKAKTYLGAVTYKRKRTWYGKVVISDFKLCISARYELSENLLEDTIIHEMIHYYILYNGLKDTSPHGRLFRQMMKAINEKFARHIVMSHRGAKLKPMT